MIKRRQRTSEKRRKDSHSYPGAAMKAITGGREMFGFPKHPVPAQLKHTYTEADGKQTELAFEAEHEGTKVSTSCSKA